MLLSVTSLSNNKTVWNELFNLSITLEGQLFWKLLHQVLSISKSERNTDFSIYFSGTYEYRRSLSEISYLHYFTYFMWIKSQPTLNTSCTINRITNKFRSETFLRTTSRHVGTIWDHRLGRTVGEQYNVIGLLCTIVSRNSEFRLFFIALKNINGGLNANIPYPLDDRYGVSR